MYVSYVKGIPCHWEYPRKILHYVSRDLWNWELASDKVVDACVIRMPDDTWKMWYKNEADQGFT